MTRWARHLYQPGLPLGVDGRRVTGSEGHIALARRAAAEGMVLLKNQDKTLPFAPGEKIALFGKGCVDYVKGGGGSGDVTCAYAASLYDALAEKEKEGKVSLFHALAHFYQNQMQAQYELGYAPGMTREPQVPEELMEQAKQFARTAVVTISRFSGEGWDRLASLEPNEAMWESELEFARRQAEIFPQGDFYLTEEERRLIGQVTSAFDRVAVVLNIGGVMESAWIAADPGISAALLAWQGGMEGGRAAADILCGDADPSGRLADTFAEKLEDYPSTASFHESKDYAAYTEDIYVGYRYFETIPGAAGKVIYPFGYGLSYTEFSIRPLCLMEDSKEETIRVYVEVENLGERAGREVVQLYYSAPQGKLGKPAKVLGAFQKTRRLAPGEKENLLLSLPVREMASYDDTGRIQKSAWVLEQGTYRFLVGNSVRNVTELPDTYTLDRDRVVCQLSQKLAPSKLKERMRSDGSLEALPEGIKQEEIPLFARMTNRETEGVAPGERGRDRYYLFEQTKKPFLDVAEGKLTLKEWMEQLSVEDLIWLLGGQENQGVSNTFGLGNLPEYGVPEIATADGPAGLRILPQVGVLTTAWPCATLLACSFNPPLAWEVGAAVAAEVKENNLGVWLAPAVNIHRSPLCGRNFEYYSEDPLLAGRIGAGMVRGVQSCRIAATVKHFAFNNKETNRKNSDSRVSERAAREIYLKAFEIIVKEASPWCIMTAYNKVNGVWCSENRELIQGILREEWGFDGLVMTDWWTSGEHYLEARAGNDLKMGNGYPERVKEAYERGAISLEEIKSCAENVLGLILKME